MRFRYLLPAALIVAGTSMAQTGATTPNAVGVWNSTTFGFIGWYIGTGFPAGTPNNQMWQALPSELTTYFNANSVANPGARELRFRGYEMSLTQFDGNSGAFPSYNGPRVQVSAAKPNPAQPQRWIPDATPVVNGLANPFVDMLSIPNLVLNNNTAPGTHYRIAADLGAGNARRVSGANNAGVGNAVMMILQDYQMQYGDGLGLFVIASTNEPASGGIAAVSYSGGSIPTANFILPNIPQSGEYLFTWLFETPMIQPVVNAKLSSGGPILGGGIAVQPFNVNFDDGRHAIHPVAGDAVSYNGNMTYGNPAPGGGVSNVWFAPFVLFSGDVAPLSTTDPNPETWNEGGNNYPYKMSVQQWIDDFCAVTSACGAGTGAIINPANSNWGLWMGLDLNHLDPNFPFGPMPFVNVSVLLNGIAFADVTSIQWSGPTSTQYDSGTNGSALMGRNLVNAGAGFVDANGALLPSGLIREFRTMIGGTQSGYTPVAGGADLNGNGTQLGFGVYPGGLGGQTFSVQAWCIDLGSNQVVDMTNVATARLQ